MYDERIKTITPVVAVGSLGGTISMTAGPVESDGVRPTLTASDLIGSVPGLKSVADVSPHTLATVPGASLSTKDLLNTLAWAQAVVDDGAAGVVLIQGTDTIEESAFLLDLYWDRAAPLVVTGAMRSAETSGADGPANLLGAVRVASSKDAQDRGVLVVMNDQIHAASQVRKIRSSGTDAFASPSFGPLGWIVESRILLSGTIDRPKVLRTPESPVFERVTIIETHLDDDGVLLQIAAKAGYSGLVLDAFGVGHVSASVADVVSTVSRSGLPIVLASRTGAGPTFSSTYGFVGSETDLLRRGVIPAGWLDGRKSRILLAALLSIGSTPDDIRREFQHHGWPMGNTTVNGAGE